MLLPHPRVKVSNFESCVWRAVSSQSSNHPQEVLLAQFSLYVHTGGLKPNSFHFIFIYINITSHLKCIKHVMLLEDRGPKYDILSE